jgi:MoxR-like ATPase
VRRPFRQVRFSRRSSADEINRTPPKTQAALLGHAVHVTAADLSARTPFFVLATQNPIELEGTYPLLKRSSTSCSTSSRI